MNLSVVLFCVLVVGVVVVLIVALRRQGTHEHDPAVIAALAGLQKSSDAVSELIRSEMATNRGELNGSLQTFRAETQQTLNAIRESLVTAIEKSAGQTKSEVEAFRELLGTKLNSIETATRDGLQELRQSWVEQSGILQKETAAAVNQLNAEVRKTLKDADDRQKAAIDELRSVVDIRLRQMSEDNEKRLEQMRQTVEEKLQGTLEARLDSSFKQVSDRLEQVHQGLGEMKSLAVGVGDLKKVLSNVKERGTWGEVRLGALLEQILAPDQFGKDVATTGTLERVEFAIRLPGSDDSGCVWLPVDSKFPMEDYQRVIDASETSDREQLEKALIGLEASIRKCAKDIHTKYLSPPKTTHFGVMFLASEGLYAEVVRRRGLAESIQREFEVLLAGPSTFAALLTSLQMGFRTLAIQRKSGEVWQTLGLVKNEFAKYAGVLAKVRGQLTTAQNHIEKAETRTRQIQRALRDVDSTDLLAAAAIPDEEKPELGEGSHETPSLLPHDI